MFMGLFKLYGRACFLACCWTPRTRRVRTTYCARIFVLAPGSGTGLIGRPSHEEVELHPFDGKVVRRDFEGSSLPLECYRLTLCQHQTRQSSRIDEFRLQQQSQIGITHAKTTPKPVRWDGSTQHPSRSVVRQFCDKIVRSSVRLVAHKVCEQSFGVKILQTIPCRSIKGGILQGPVDPFLRAQQQEQIKIALAEWRWFNPITAVRGGQIQEKE